MENFNRENERKWFFGFLAFIGISMAYNLFVPEKVNVIVENNLGRDIGSSFTKNLSNDFKEDSTIKIDNRKYFVGSYTTLDSKGGDIVISDSFDKREQAKYDPEFEYFKRHNSSYDKNKKYRNVNSNSYYSNREKTLEERLESLESKFDLDNAKIEVIK